MAAVVIKRLRKSELSGVKFNETEIPRYGGPPNPPMPREQALYQVMPLTFLARKAISINRAMNLDSTFLHYILTDKTTPGFNTKYTKHLNTIDLTLNI